MAGFGTVYSDPATLPAGIVSGVKFSPAGDAVLCSHAGSPYISAYQWTPGVGFGTKYSDPTIVGTNTANAIDISPDGTVALLTDFNSPGIHAWQWSSSTGFGTKYSNPATLPGACVDCKFSKSGQAVVLVTNNVTPFTHAYAWNNITGFGAKYPNPASLPTGATRVAFHPTNEAIAFSKRRSGLSQFACIAYPWSDTTGFGVAYATAPFLGSLGDGTSVAFSPDGQGISVGLNQSPWVFQQSWTASTGPGARYTNIATMANAYVRDINFRETRNYA